MGCSIELYHQVLEQIENSESFTGQRCTGRLLLESIAQVLSQADELVECASAVAASNMEQWLDYLPGFNVRALGWRRSSVTRSSRPEDTSRVFIRIRLPTIGDRRLGLAFNEYVEFAGERGGQREVYLVRPGEETSLYITSQKRRRSLGLVFAQQLPLGSTTPGVQLMQEKPLALYEMWGQRVMYLK